MMWPSSFGAALPDPALYDIVLALRGLQELARVGPDAEGDWRETPAASVCVKRQKLTRPETLTDGGEISRLIERVRVGRALRTYRRSRHFSLGAGDAEYKHYGTRAVYNRSATKGRPY